jgi:ribonuclease HI
MIVTIYTDGGADPNPGVGGWAAILRAGGKEKVLTGSEPSTTNNRMELTAAIAALEALRWPSQVEFHTDSEYVRRGITEWIDDWQKQSWQRKGKPIPNADLWQKLASLAETHQIDWHWVRGHSGNRLNERVDMLARDARLAISPVATASEESLRLYVRGTCKGNPGPGAWAAVLEHDGETSQASGAERSTTNNRMELMAVIGGMALIPDGAEAYVVTTSDYVFMGATRWIHGWRRRDWKKRDGRPVSNLDLWQQVEALIERHSLHWISGKGEPEQFEQGLEEAAVLARQALTMEE